MSEEKISKSIENLGRALERLKEAVQEPDDNQFIIDATIQRFEFVIELFWKTLKRVLAAEGISTSTPKDTLKKAYALGWLNDESAWLQMLKDRNETSHVYNEEMAKTIYQNIKDNFNELEKVYHKIVGRA